MATENTVVAVPMPVAADYSSAGQYLFVDVNSSGQAVVIAAQGVNAIGVLQDNPAAAGRVGRIAVGGMIKVMSGDTITAGNRITSGADGRAEVAATGDFVLGTAMVSSVDGDIMTMLFQPQDISA